MSEPSFPFGGQTPAGRPVEAAAPTEAPDDAKRRNLVIGGVAAAAAVAVAAGAFLLLSGGDDSAVAVSTPKGRPPAVAAAPTATPTETIPDTFKGAVGTDPFHALVVPVVAAAPAPSAPAPTSAPTTPAPASTVIVALPAPTVTVTAKPSATSGWTVRLLKITAPKTPSDVATADISVNGHVYPGLKVGDKFGDMFRLLELDGTSAAAIQFGDGFFGVGVGHSFTVQ